MSRSNVKIGFLVFYIIVDSMRKNYLSALGSCESPGSPTGNRREEVGVGGRQRAELKTAVLLVRKDQRR